MPDYTALFFCMTMFATMQNPSVPPCGSPQLLRESWEAYKTHFIQKDGRVVDHDQGGITTSEGQAYALFRAVWIDDQATFNRVLRWTQNNLQVRPDHLLAWKWGRDSTGEWGVLDLETASDADQLFALSLFLAFVQWGETRYREAALAVLSDIWQRETLEIGGQLFLKPGTWGEGEGRLRINPSYYFPFAYRVFAFFDPDHPWQRLLKSAYRVLEEARNLVGLPVNWAEVTPKGRIVVPAEDPLNPQSDYGYDALRVYLNLAIDVAWFEAPDSRALMTGAPWPGIFFTVRGHGPAEVTYWGFERRPYRALVFDAVLLPFLRLTDTKGYQRLCQDLLQQYRDGLWGDGDYYTQNILWFSLAVLHGVPEVWRRFFQ